MVLWLGVPTLLQQAQVHWIVSPTLMVMELGKNLSESPLSLIWTFTVLAEALKESRRMEPIIAPSQGVLRVFIKNSAPQAVLRTADSLACATRRDGIPCLLVLSPVLTAPAALRAKSTVEFMGWSLTTTTV